jgi:hypothetical protein
VIATDAERAQSVALDGEINRCACVSCQESFIHLCEGSLAAPVKFSPQRRARRSAIGTPALSVPLPGQLAAIRRQFGRAGADAG